MIKLTNVDMKSLLPSFLQNDFIATSAVEALEPYIHQVADLLPRLPYWSNIDGLSEEWLDILAVDWKAPFYEQSLPIEKKRELVKKMFMLKRKKGTVGVVEDLITMVFGTGKVVPWYEYDGEPGYFKVQTNDPSANADRAQEFIRAIESVKGITSHLEAVEIVTSAETVIYYGLATHSGTISTIEQVV